MAGSRGAKGTSDTNQTDPIKAQGPLSDTLDAYDEWDMNKLKDPTSRGDKMQKGSGSKP